MNQDQFNELTEKLLTACKDALGMKAGEYAREGDRLHNFYAAARKRNQHPLDSLLGMQVKHRVSIDDICEDIVKHGKFPTDEMMLEKFKDDINYNLLAFALIHELRAQARKEIFAAGLEKSEGSIKESFDRFIKTEKRLDEYYRACMQQPPRTIKRVEPQFTIPKPSVGYVSVLQAALHPNAMQKVLFNGRKYLPVPEEKENNCTGCFFEKAGLDECRRFRAVAGSRFDDFCEGAGVIWKKIV